MYITHGWWRFGSPGRHCGLSNMCWCSGVGCLHGQKLAHSLHARVSSSRNVGIPVPAVARAEAEVAVAELATAAVASQAAKMPIAWYGGGSKTSLVQSTLHRAFGNAAPAYADAAISSSGRRETCWGTTYNRQSKGFVHAQIGCYSNGRTPDSNSRNSTRRRMSPARRQSSFRS